ncbi:phage integrase [Erwinia sp. LJJL01]|uniref:phage integrase n=1 Tax=Erwinia sp. LJJL01 TaxID=3391839 RepID=UPI0010604489
MTVKSLGAEGWQVDVRPRGRDGRRIRKKFPTKAEAVQFERWAIATGHNKEWLDKPKDKRPLSELIDLWWKHKGQLLRAGEDTHRRLILINEKMGHPSADKINPATFSDYRAMRISAGRSPKTLNLEQEYLSSLFSTLIELGHFGDPNPLAGMKKITLVKNEMGFLNREEITELLEVLEGDNRLVTKLCLATGARWDEAASLTSERVIHNRVTYTKTKNGSNRTVPISPALSKELLEGKKRLLFPAVKYLEVREAIKTLAPHLPDGQATHVLRHTFASHFMMNGGNILALQKILGHSRIEQTMVYAHFAPDYLNDAVKFNPLNNFTLHK